MNVQFGEWRACSFQGSSVIDYSCRISPQLKHCTQSLAPRNLKPVSHNENLFKCFKANKSKVLSLDANVVKDFGYSERCIIISENHPSVLLNS